MYKHQDLAADESQIEQVWVIFTHLKLWVAVATHNFKWVKMEIPQLSASRVTMIIDPDFRLLHIYFNYPITRSPSVKTSPITLEQDLFPN